MNERGQSVLEWLLLVAGMLLIGLIVAGFFAEDDLDWEGEWRYLDCDEWVEMRGPVAFEDIPARPDVVSCDKFVLGVCSAFRSGGRFGVRYSGRCCEDGYYLYGFNRRECSSRVWVERREAGE